jgi:hypothetical protein
MGGDGERNVPTIPSLRRRHRSRIAPDFAAIRIGIRRYLVAPTAARRDPRALKHLKHETSTKHRCAATIRLEMTGAGAAHTGLASNSEFANERAWPGSAAQDFDVRCFRFRAR